MPGSPPQLATSPSFNPTESDISIMFQKVDTFFTILGGKCPTKLPL